ncbi:MAG: helix-turn-helix transcriptional regulator [Rhodanobacteraceae bacterium]|nr:helix-turn-helix transcriptional regulator [Rhodanobacteraceae bacterium]
MLTNFGKALRKIRIDRDKTLGDLGDLLGVSPSFVSALETGKKAVPPSLLNQIVAVLSLTAEDQAALSEAASQQAKEVSISLRDRSDRAKELAVAFARRFESMSDADVEKLLEKLKTDK